MLYLGLQDYFEAFMWQGLIKYHEEKSLRETQAKLEEAAKLAAEQGEQVEEADDNSDEENKDIKEISFLKQFPNLSIFFNDNQSLIKKKGKTKGFRLNTGGWVAPTCCSMVINMIQLQLTFQSIMMTKGNP